MKDNCTISFSFANHEITSKLGSVTNLYYRNFKNKNITIRNREMPYMPATDILLIHDDTYEVLKATNRLDDSLFVFIVRYSVNDDGEETEKETNFYFKVVSEKQYDAYKNVKKMDINGDEDGEIKHPKKQN